MSPVPVDYRKAGSIEEARALLEEYGFDARPVSGGSALALLMRQGLIWPSMLVGIGHLRELRGMEVNGQLTLGAGVPLRKIEQNEAVRARWPALVETLERVATPRVRNMATLGGGLAHADPAQDPPVTLAALRAQVRLSGPGGERRLPVEDFCMGYYENALEEGELVTAVEVPAPEPGAGAVFLKFLPRTAEDYATVAAAASVRLDPDGVCQDARLVLGSVAARPLVVDVSGPLVGERPTDARLRAAAELARADVDPTEDVRGSVEYKTDMAVLFGQRALAGAVARATRQDSTSNR